MPSPAQPPVPRGRHAPPLEVRVEVQRVRLFTAAAAVFARVGFADASAEAVSREAGMSKATFYEHFANKEECILALFDQSRAYVLSEMERAAGSPDDVASYREWVRRSLAAFVDILAVHPDQAQTLLVEIIGAGPRAIARRDAVMDLFARLLLRDNALIAPRFGTPQFASQDDAFACIGAVFEVVSRQLRTGQPEDIRAVAPILERVILGVLHESERR
ncbi:MAG: TetR/AcrR family transcriptional regulator [Solirubrobacterales bacterium]|jgi:AcrR family transcriptional regulator|nr:TetR/AcrR family transcriptional regulator [Solirubrobacterales bacterium]